MGEKEKSDYIKWFKMETAKIAQKFKIERERRTELFEAGLLGRFASIVPQPKPMDTNIDYLRMSMPRIIDDVAAIVLYYGAAVTLQNPFYLPMDTLESMNINITRIFASGKCSSDLGLSNLVKETKGLVNSYYERYQESCQRLRTVHAAHHKL
jgi:hypothetical protein